MRIFYVDSKNVVRPYYLRKVSMVIGPEYSLIDGVKVNTLLVPLQHLRAMYKTQRVYPQLQIEKAKAKGHDMSNKPLPLTLEMMQEHNLNVSECSHDTKANRVHITWKVQPNWYEKRISHFCAFNQRCVHHVVEGA